jgi:hypothetical protein
MRLPLRVGLLLAASAGALSAQSVRGAVVDAGGVPVSGVVVQLLTATDSIVSRALSNQAGEFFIATTAAGTYRVRTLRIGYRPTTSEPVTLRAGEELSRRFEISGVAVTLANVRIEGESGCRRSASDSTSVAFAAWEQLRTALSATQITALSRGMTVTTIEYVRALDPLGRKVLSDEAAVRTELVRQPWQEQRADQLRAKGYITDDIAGNVVYHVPGLETLSSSAFLEDHCLRLARESTDERLGISFEPTTTRRDFAEIRGVAWLDRKTSELREVTFGYSGIAEERIATAGGKIEFTRIEDGTWVISRWHVRMPILELVSKDNSRGGSENKLSEIRETGAQLTVARRGTDTLWIRDPLPLSGQVTDSLTKRPVPFAVASLVGTSFRDTADANGRFTIQAVPGEYTLEIRTPSLDSVKAVHQSRVAFIDTAATFDVKVPNAEFIQRVMFGRNRAILTGFVVVDSTDAPIRDVEISLPGLSKTVKTDEKGAFRIVDVPEGVHRVLARRIGYGLYDAPTYFMAGHVVQRKIVLPRVSELKAVEVTAERGTAGLPESFAENVRLGIGHFTTREDLEKMGNRQLGNIVGESPGMKVVPGRGGQAWILSKRAPVSLSVTQGNRPSNIYYPSPGERSRGMVAACYARVYLDGSLINPSTPAEPFDLNTLPLQSIEAIEIFSGPAQVPAKYARLDTSCGVVVIHSRRAN